MAKRADVRRAATPLAAMWLVFFVGAAIGVAVGSLWPLLIGIALGMVAAPVVRARQRRSQRS
jgi:hypothetical protein